MENYRKICVISICCLRTEGLNLIQSHQTASEGQAFSKSDPLDLNQAPLLGCVNPSTGASFLLILGECRNQLGLRALPVLHFWPLSSGSINHTPLPPNPWVTRSAHLLPSTTAVLLQGSSFSLGITSTAQPGQMIHPAGSATAYRKLKGLPKPYQRLVARSITISFSCGLQPPCRGNLEKTIVASSSSQFAATAPSLELCFLISDLFYPCFYFSSFIPFQVICFNTGLQHFSTTVRQLHLMNYKSLKRLQRGLILFKEMKGLISSSGKIRF